MLEAQVRALTPQPESGVVARMLWGLSWRGLVEALQWTLLCGVLPMSLLLLAHALITVVYDWPMWTLQWLLWLLPLPFGMLLQWRLVRPSMGWRVLVWLGVLVTVLGMCATIARVDHTPLWPQGAAQWREVIEFALSMAISYHLGMGLMAWWQRRARSA